MLKDPLGDFKASSTTRKEARRLAALSIVREDCLLDTDIISYYIDLEVIRLTFAPF